MKLRLLFISFGFLAFSSSMAIAQSQVAIETVPTAWRLQNYANDNIVLWYTGSSCTNGSLGSDNLSLNDKSRLYATVMSAKLSNANMYVYYIVNGSTCEIESFGMDAP
jgi:hypothetical protein